MHSEAQYFVGLLSPYILSYGYWVAFFGMMLENAGIPVPAETALIICSFFAGQGVLKIWYVISVAILGDVIGDNIGFCIGRFGGRPMVEKYGRYIGLGRDKLDAMEALFKQKGGRTVFTAHFFATTRIATALISGISHMHYPRFLVFNIAAAVMFVTGVAGITFFFGKNLEATLHFFHLFRIVCLVIAVLLATSFLYRFYQKRKHLHNKLGLKIIAVATTASIFLGITFYAVSEALIVLPRTSSYAGQVHGVIKGVEFDVEQGFISGIDNDRLLITALGHPRITFSESKQPQLISVTVRNIAARDTVVQKNSKIKQAVALDDLTLLFNITLRPNSTRKVVFKPRVVTDRFTFIVTADTHESGPLFKPLIQSINDKNPAFLIHAGDFVKYGKKRGYRMFLDEINALAVPLYTTLGSQELTNRGEPRALKLFGPKNYSFTHQNSKFIILNTSQLVIQGQDLDWLEKELNNNETAENIFLITYSAPVSSKRFIDFMAKYRVKAVYSVLTMGTYAAVIKHVRYEVLEQKPDNPYFYKIITVDGSTVKEETVKLLPHGLSLFDKMELSYEDIKRNIISSFTHPKSVPEN
jgi:membrane protein DedA with SNARE-associated domain